MADEKNKVLEPNYSFNNQYREDTVRVTVNIPGLKPQVSGLKDGLLHGLQRKVDPSNCDLKVAFSNRKVVLDATILSGTHTGTQYHLELDEDDCRVSIQDAPYNSYDVKGETVRIYLKRPS